MGAARRRWKFRHSTEVALLGLFVRMMVLEAR